MLCEESRGEYIYIYIELYSVPTLYLLYTLLCTLRCALLPVQPLFSRHVSRSDRRCRSRALPCLCFAACLVGQAKPGQARPGQDQEKHVGSTLLFSAEEI